MSENLFCNYHLWQNIFFALLSIIITSSMLGCKGQFPKNIKDYYYPINDLSDGLVYQYTTTNSDQQSVSNYWYFKSNIINDTIHFTGQYYDAKKTVGQFFRQSITDQGAIYKDYNFYVYNDSSDQASVIQLQIHYASAFPFQVKDTTSIYLYKLSFIAPADSSLNTITRNRRFVGEEEWEHNGKVYPAIRIKLLERIENDRQGVLTIDFKGYEIYAKGIGLVYTFRSSENGTRIEDRLIDRVLMSDFQ
ncbi:MAG: hypothetical protein KJP00_06520 [Bacteroidia bacterium]|nr:hypothetical protein [Bacteroidia bacterium]